MNICVAVAGELIAGAVAADLNGATPSAKLGLLPLAKPNAPKLSEALEELAAIEDSSRLSNYGPVNSRLEAEIIEKVFGGIGHCTTVCNATIGLILSLKSAVNRFDSSNRRFVMMPSFTFAAAAHAVLWAGFTPLLVDVDEREWSANEPEERRLLEKFNGEIAAIMPYATFGSNIDLARYDRLSTEYEVPIVVDAAASLGGLSENGSAFGSGTQHTIVYSMHATKAFAVGECGLVYSNDQAAIETIRRMGNFGFDGLRSATMAGLNSKISEVTALAGLLKLKDYDSCAWHRMHLADAYRYSLSNLQLQQYRGDRIAYQFMPVLLPEHLAGRREKIMSNAAKKGITLGKYFSPHIFEQPYFKPLCVAGPLDITKAISSRILSLPISDFMTAEEVYRVAHFMQSELVL